MAEATILIEDVPSDPNSKTKLISISGQLDESNVDEKSKEVYKVFEENPGKLSLIFDFAGLEYMNSKSIGYLTDWYGKITERGGQVLIARAKPNIQDILQVVGLTQLIKIHESLDEAKAHLGQQGQENTETPAEAPAPVEPAPTETPAPAEPAEAPVEEPAPEATETPAEVPTPAEPPAEAPVEPTPAETPVEAPVVPTPAEPPAEAPVEPTPAEAPVEAPVEPTPAEPTTPETYKLSE